MWTWCAATWSSGSTFLTKLLTHYPGVFLSFEPLVLFSTYDALHDAKAGQARATLRDIFHCNFTEKSWGRKYLRFLKSPSLENYLKTVSTNLTPQPRDTECLPSTTSGWGRCARAWRRTGQTSCATTPSMSRTSATSTPSTLSRQSGWGPGRLLHCWMNQVHKDCGVILVKTIYVLSCYILDLNVKMIVLMRDPRAVRSSRNKIGWCNFEACNSASVLCNHYEMDLEDAFTLTSTHPDNVLIVKYEELVTRPLDVIPIMLQVYRRQSVMLHRCICVSLSFWACPGTRPWPSLSPTTWWWRWGTASRAARSTSTPRARWERQRERYRQRRYYIVHP